MGTQNLRLDTVLDRNNPRASASFRVSRDTFASTNPSIFGFERDPAHGNDPASPLAHCIYEANVTGRWVDAGRTSETITPAGLMSQLVDVELPGAFPVDLINSGGGSTFDVFFEYTGGAGRPLFGVYEVTVTLVGTGLVADTI